MIWIRNLIQVVGIQCTKSYRENNEKERDMMYNDKCTSGPFNDTSIRQDMPFVSGFSTHNYKESNVYSLQFLYIGVLIGQSTPSYVYVYELISPSYIHYFMKWSKHPLSYITSITNTCVACEYSRLSALRHKKNFFVKRDLVIDFRRSCSTCFTSLKAHYISCHTALFPEAVFAFAMKLTISDLCLLRIWWYVLQKLW